MVDKFDISQLDEVVIFKGNGGDLIDFYREGRYIYLEKPGNERTKYRFDLVEGIFERLNHYKTVEDKITQVPTENITGWFTNCRLVTKDVHFGRLVLFAKFNVRFDSYTSPVRFIEQLGSSVISNIEKWEALGLHVEEIERFFSDHLYNDSSYNPYDFRKSIFFGEGIRGCWSGGKRIPWFRGYLTYGPQDFSKELLNHIKTNYNLINDSILTKLHENYNHGEAEYEKMLMKKAEDPEFIGVFEYEETSYNTTYIRSIFDNERLSTAIRINLIHLIQEFNLDIDSLCRWLKKQKNVERNSLNYLCGNRMHYYDYLRSEKDLKDGSLSKMTKYPDNFRTRFHIVSEEIAAKVASIDRALFASRKEEYKYLEYSDKYFTIFIPNTPEEIDHEAQELDHCVRTYIKPMTKGTTLILFCRFAAFPDEPLVTLEVKSNILKQAYGKNDSKPTSDVLEFLQKWLDVKGVTPGCWTKDLKQ